jgi:hypothetical protein
MSSKQLAYAAALAHLLRRDVYAVKTEDGYRTVTEKVTSLVLERHIENVRPIGGYPLKGDSTEVGVLDFDDHDGCLGWEKMTAAVARVVVVCLAAGLQPHVFRSGGGKGVHLWFHWPVAQSARDVRHHLRNMLSAAGLTEGAGGVGRGQVEVFPKQDKVEPGKLGSLIAIPGARDSAPLDVELLVPLSWDEIDVGTAMMRASARPPEVLEEETRPTAFVRLAGDDSEVADALNRVLPNDYHVWIRVALGLKHNFGEAGFDIFDKWSATSQEKYPGTENIRKFWGGLKPNGQVGIGTIFHLARGNGWNGPSDGWVREMNGRFGILTYASTTQIILKNGDRRPDDLPIGLSKSAFTDRLAGEKVTIVGPDGPRTLNKARAWLNHPRASHFTRVDFDPSMLPGANGTTWNTWTGFAVEPWPGDWSLLQDHISANVANGDASLADWLLNWMALGVQRPGDLIGTAPVLIGLPGTGKGVLVHAYGSLWGPHYQVVTHAEHVLGRFGGHFMGKRLVYIDEGLFGGNRREAGVLKTRITDEWIILESKGVDAIRMRNRMIFIITSNETSVVPADLHDRRWGVFKAGDQRREDHEYFGAIVTQLNNGGREAMLYDLLHRDISKGPDPRRTIKTEGLFEQQLQAQSAEFRFVYHLLALGRLPQGWLEGANITTIQALHVEFQQQSKVSGYVDLARLAKAIQKMLPSVKTEQAGNYFIRMDDYGRNVTQRSTRYIFPDLERAREDFAHHAGGTVTWPAADGWQADVDPTSDPL